MARRTTPPSRSATATALVKLGVKYGPVVYEAVKRGKEPARQAAEREVARASSRRRAMEHAHHLVDGSVLTVFDGDKRLFVVFNGDEPVASHPASAKPLRTLLQGYDLTKRVRPSQGRARRFAPLSRRGSAGQASATGFPPASGQTPALTGPGGTATGTPTPGAATSAPSGSGPSTTGAPTSGAPTTGPRGPQDPPAATHPGE